MTALVLNQIFLRANFILQGIQGVTSAFALIFIPSFLIRLCNCLCDVSGIIPVLVTNADFDVIRVSDLFGFQDRLKLEQSHVSVESIPASGEIESFYHSGHGPLGLDDLKLVLYVGVRR